MARRKQSSSGFNVSGFDGVEMSVDLGEAIEQWRDEFVRTVGMTDPNRGMAKYRRAAGWAVDEVAKTAVQNIRYRFSQKLKHQSSWTKSAVAYKRLFKADLSGLERGERKVEDLYAQVFVKPKQSAYLKYLFGLNPNVRLPGDVGLASRHILIPWWDNITKTQGLHPTADGNVPRSFMSRLARQAAEKAPRKGASTSRWGVYYGSITLHGVKRQAWIARPPRVPVTDQDVLRGRKGASALDQVIVIRVAHLDDGPRFIATDICKALKLTNPSVSLKALDADERSKIFLGPQGEVLAVTEGGLYSLIMRCQRALVQGSTAWRFRKWATGKVLPTIRRTGRFEAEPVAPAPLPQPVDPMAFLADPRNMLTLLGTYAQRTIELEGVVAEKSQALVIAQDTIDEQSVTVAAHDRIAEADGTYTVTITAKHLGVSPGALFEYLRNGDAKVRWLYERRPGDTSDDVAIQERLDAGDLVEKVKVIVVKRSGEEPRDKTVTRVNVTPKGLTRLARLIVERRDPLLPVPKDVLRAARLAKGHPARDPDLFD